MARNADGPPVRPRNWTHAGAALGGCHSSRRGWCSRSRQDPGSEHEDKEPSQRHDDPPPHHDENNQGVLCDSGHIRRVRVHASRSFARHSSHLGLTGSCFFAARTTACATPRCRRQKGRWQTAQRPPSRGENAPPHLAQMNGTIPGSTAPSSLRVESLPQGGDHFLPVRVHCAPGVGSHPMPIGRQNSGCARFHRSCAKLVTLARRSRRDETQPEWRCSTKETTTRSPSSSS